jgi:hypothetical protein
VRKKPGQEDDGNNLHRNVIYRDGGDLAGQLDPLTTAKPWGSPDPRDIWKWMEACEEKTHGEAPPFLSLSDEFADYETWGKSNPDLTEVRQPAMLEFEYARSALKNSLRLEEELGVNLYKFGMIGSTDTHTALSTADEENFFGKASTLEPNAARAEHSYMENPELIKVWTDPDWTAFDDKYFNAQIPPDGPMTMRERAYTSPIWYAS